MTARARATIAREAERQNIPLATLSRCIGRNDAYLQQFLRRGTPRVLPDLERLHLAMRLNVDERELGARDPWTPVKPSA